MSSEVQKSKYPDVAAYLTEFYEKRRKKNPNYSQRAFSRDVGVSSGRLSELISGKTLPGDTLKQRIAEALKLTKIQRNQFYLMIENHVDQKRKKKIKKIKRLVSEQEFKFLPDWKHFAVLNLLNTANFKPEAKWMSNRLGLPLSSIEDSLKNLHQAGLIEKTDGFYKATHQNMTSTTNIPSSAIRNYHRQMIERSLWSLENVPLELRDITAMMVTANPNKLYKLKILSQEFKQKAAEILDDGDTTEVYTICVQIVPTTIVDP